MFTNTSQVRLVGEAFSLPSVMDRGYKFMNEFLTIPQIQREVRSWTKHNFPIHPNWHPLVGMQEELGELSHAFLKRDQAIRNNEAYYEDICDAIGDLMIYLCDFCNGEAIDLQQVTQRTWEKVRERDWQKNPTTGGV